MTLGGDDLSLQIESNITNCEFDVALSQWRYSSPSVILHHGKPCCSVAREWLFSTDHSLLNGQHKLMGPRWVRNKFKWGPSRWPMTWCQAVEQDELDCGALAAITQEIFVSRGVVCHSVQLIQGYSEATASHWSTKWANHHASIHWIAGAFIYHEVCAVETRASEIEVWDPSASSWVNPKQNGGYGSVVALRLIKNSAPDGMFIWGERQIVSNEWQLIQGDYGYTEKDRCSKINNTLIEEPIFPAAESRLAALEISDRKASSPSPD